jgi:hypothetical protein
MFPRWLSWMFLLTMGYVIVQAGQGGNPVTPTPSKVVPPVTRENYPALAETTDLERWKRKLNPDYAAVTNCSLDDLTPEKGLHVKVVIDSYGAGARAACGEAIRIHLTVWGADGKEAYAEKIPFNLGAREIAAGLDYGLLGITVGESRSLIIPPYALLRSKESKAPAAAIKALPTTRVANVTVKRIL